MIIPNIVRNPLILLFPKALTAILNKFVKFIFVKLLNQRKFFLLFLLKLYFHPYSSFSGNEAKVALAEATRLLGVS